MLMLSVGIDIISSLPVLLPAIIILQYVFYRSHNIKRMVSVMVFAIYIAAVFSLTGIPAINALMVDLSFNFIPVADIVNSPIAYMVNTILNIFLFVPLGILLPLLWNDYCSIKKTIIMGFGLSLFIEILQIFTFRLTDIDDLITNTIGTILGYFISRILAINITQKLENNSSLANENIYARYEPFIIIIIVFLAMYIVQPFISGVIWDYIYLNYY